MKDFMSSITDIMLYICWGLGIYFAKGYLTFIAIFFPPYAWYLVIEHFATKFL